MWMHLPEGVESNSLLLECELGIVTYFQRVQCGSGKDQPHSRDPAKHGVQPAGRGSRPCGEGREQCSASALFFPKTR